MTKISRAAMCVAVLAIGSMTACSPARQAKQAVDDIDSGNAAACAEERSTIEKAVEAYSLLNPDVTVTEAGMVAAGYIHEPSVLMDVTATGAVVPAPNSPC